MSMRTWLALGTSALSLGCAVPNASGDGRPDESGDAPTEDNRPAGADEDTIACGADVAHFQREVWEPVLNVHCVGCHLEGGVGASSRFMLVADDLEASMYATVAVIDRLAVRPQGLDGHGGGAVLAPDGDEVDRLEAWVDWVEGECESSESLDCAPDAVPPRRLRRLSHREYRQTMLDLFEVDPLETTSLAGDPSVGGFDNDADALVVEGLLAEQYRLVAEGVAEDIPLWSWISCSPWSGGDECARATARDWAIRVWRRPLQASEEDALASLWAVVSAEEGPEWGLRWMMAGMLQAPAFLYRSELGVQLEAGEFSLTDWELATAMSYQIWGTTPDEELLAAAAAGELQDDAFRSEQVARLLADPRAQGQVADLVDAWLHVGRLDTVSRVGLTDESRDELREEFRDGVMRTVESGGSVEDLVETEGILRSPALLTAHGVPEGSGPVQRGVFIRERMLCEPLPPPPVGIDATPPEADPSQSTRDRFSQHSEDPTCSGCHDKVDPLGFAFEQYDQLGQWRDTDSGHAIDASGALDGVAFDGTDGLAEVLLDDGRMESCYMEMARRWLRGAESCASDERPETLSEPLTEFTLRPAAWAAFATRTGGEDEADTVAR